MHPIERLRYVARVGGVDQGELVREASSALGGFGSDVGGLIVSCRRLLDRHPTAGNVLLVGAGSGHGFKHGPEVGRYASELLTGKLKSVEPRFSLASKEETQNRAVH